MIQRFGTNLFLFDNYNVIVSTKIDEQQRLQSSPKSFTPVKSQEYPTSPKTSSSYDPSLLPVSGVSITPGKVDFKSSERGTAESVNELSSPAPPSIKFSESPLKLNTQADLSFETFFEEDSNNFDINDQHSFGRSKSSEKRYSLGQVKHTSFAV